MALRLMTYNLRRDVQADAPHTWEARRALVIESVQAHAPAVLGTQEGLPHQLADLDAALPEYARVGVPRAEGDESCALYYARDRFTLVDSGTWWLSDTPHAPGSATWGNRHPRVVTWARLAPRGVGRELLVANTHLDHESEAARRRAVALLAEQLPGAILMGDLNAAPGDPAHTFLLGAGWDDGGAHEPTFHGFSGRARVRLDHILVPRAYRLRSHALVAHARGGVHASDHHAVVADVDERRADP
ncbi:MAG TPA: endonuclease/exonuclease/phosphatase family protein [Candidatus Thermoplasmatota archaeon]|nr:endonuclease/exonuclease/phosphatase family protein [Candidatus Thermoplasmatota archaeon]